MANIIIYVDGHQIQIDEKEIKIYDPFPDKEEQKKNETTEKSGSDN